MTLDIDSAGDGLITSGSRRIYTEEEFENLYLRHNKSKQVSFRQKSSLILRRAFHKIRISYCGPNTNDGFGSQLLRFMYNFFPFIDIIRHYDVKNWLANDLITGFTIGVMHVPQGMAYAMLASVPPIYGLYCSMCASFFYFLLGTSRHLSLSTIAIISLLVGSCLDRTIPRLFSGASVNESKLVMTTIPTDDPKETANRVLLASVLAFTVGIIQLIMGLLRLGFLTSLLSDPMLAGFTVGSSVHVGISQIFVILGLNLKKHTGIFNIPLNFYQICANLPKANWVTFGLSLACMFLLYLFQLRINPPLKKRIKVPVPIELLVIILGGVTSFYLKLKDDYKVKVVGTIPTGFPSPEIPQLSLAGAVLGDAFVIALIGFALSYSLASFYGNKEGYKVDPNQELMAYGITNAAGSFFTIYPVGSSISRTALVNAMGGKTQLVSLIASIFVLVVVLFAGPLFYHVPSCCLSAIILVALRGMVLQLLELPVLWRYSFWDFASWVVTFLAAVFLDVLYGLIIGIAFSILAIFSHLICSKAYTVAHVEDTEVFRSNELYSSCIEDPNVKIVRYEGGLFYTVANLFVSSVTEAAGFDPRPIAIARKKLDAVIREADVVLNECGCDFDEIELSSQQQEETPKDTTMNVDIQMNEASRCKKICQKFHTRNNSPSKAANIKQAAQEEVVGLLSTVPISHVILDCSTWTFIDVVGANTLKALLSDFNSAGVTVYLASPSRNVHRSLIRSGLFEKFPRSIVFISVFDAYASIQHQRQHQTSCSEEV
ncbi:unnamed protein product [Hymenolepis diminuta]|uniref:STAS domain-containing protein n=1 Tax=Hymenolepis diminuta TaxID=6216 RepID=A0A564Z2L2_HYMDI|nr:unnamed protein product [Hymenolepis diminuta]